jgi:outer membrane receptor protein involved in Fe transport
MLAVVNNAPSMAQGVTTASIQARVVNAGGAPLDGALVVAVHEPSGTTYQARTRADGRASIPGMRVGGPYRVTVSYIGFGAQTRENVYLSLGVSTDLEFVMREVPVELEEVTVTAPRVAILSSERTGASTAVDRDVLSTLPTISRRIEDIARLTPQYSGAGFGFSFAGQDNRLNNITVDGAYFNNSFGLAGQPGDRTGVAPISLEAIEQIQVNIAPYDVRQGNFVGAGVNTVTKSGTNEVSGSFYFQYRNQDLVGTKVLGGAGAGGFDFDPGTFRYSLIGASLGGPIVRNRLFFFSSFEHDGFTEPGTTFRANSGGEPIGGNVTRVLRSDLDALSNYLRTNFGYETGPYQGYDDETPATRFLVKFDYNVSDRSKVTLRYNHLDSRTDVLISNSSSLGFGGRRTNNNALNFQNSNYIIKENIRSVVGEWNAMVGQRASNNLLIGYSYHDESRDSRGDFFPMVDILEGGVTYTTFGFEPFTPNNELRYRSFQVQENFSIYGRAHTWTFGLSAERYHSDNVFFPGSQSIYVYNSLADFYADADDFLRTCGTNRDAWSTCRRASSPVTLRRFQVRWMNIPGMEKPLQPLKVWYAGIYAQDEWRIGRNLRLTLGFRVDVPFFDSTGYQNAQADALIFRDEDGNPVQYRTAKLPDPNLLLAPRLGFNWDVTGDRKAQVRGGTGIFTGRPAYVWISNQIGNTGVLTGFERLDNTRLRPFHPDPNHYKPTTVTGAPAATYELALTDPDFKFPQLWRSNLAVDQQLPFGLVGSVEFMYSRDVNGIYYINANLPAPDARFNGPDSRPRWTAGNRIHRQVDNAIVLKNQNVGYSWNFAASVERPFSRGWFAKAAYSYGVAKNTVDPGSIAFGSWNNNPHSGDPNNPGLAFAATSPGHRIFAAVSYRGEYLGFGATTITLFWEGRNNGNASYTFSGDLNGDGGTSNDLIYIHRDISEMNFEPYTVTVGGVTRTFSAAEQAAAWDAFIKQDKYLSKHRGQYAERNAVFLPMVFRADLSVVQDFFTDIAGRRNRLQLRLDILNVGNLINSDWGVGKRLVTTTPLIARGADANGVARYRLRNIGTDLISKSLEPSVGFGDVYRIQLGLRYVFN